MTIAAVTADRPSALHFGAGNIGRGFIGLALNRGGYDVTFIDVADALISSINAASSYQVREVGHDATVHIVDRISGINSRNDPDAAVRAVARADVVTCAVGPSVLRRIAPIISEGLRARHPSLPPVVVMACENAIGASDQLRSLVIGEGLAPEHLDALAVFAGTAVDRIIPTQDADVLDVIVEDFSEWVIDRSVFTHGIPNIPDAHFVDDLSPFIERKLFTLNTAHATAAYHGFIAGATTISEAFALPEVRTEVDAVLAATSMLLVAKHGFVASEHAAYVARAIERLSNPALPDTCLRIGRQPLRKISRHERFISPAAQIAEQGGDPAEIVRAYRAALHFRDPDDEQSVELAARLAAQTPADFVAEATGIDAQHPLFATLVAATASASGALRHGA